MRKYLIFMFGLIFAVSFVSCKDKEPDSSIARIPNTNSTGTVNPTGSAKTGGPSSFTPGSAIPEDDSAVSIVQGKGPIDVILGQRIKLTATLDRPKKIVTINFVNENTGKAITVEVPLSEFGDYIEIKWGNIYQFGILDDGSNKHTLSFCVFKEETSDHINIAFIAGDSEGMLNRIDIFNDKKIIRENLGRCTYCLLNKNGAEDYLCIKSIIIENSTNPDYFFRGSVETYF
jgi:hypothetical protein